MNETQMLPIVLPLKNYHDREDFFTTKITKRTKKNFVSFVTFVVKFGCGYCHATHGSWTKPPVSLQ